MFWNLFILFLSVTTFAFGSVVKEHRNYCSPSEFSCKDGACVSLDRFCDAHNDCADGSDEAFCHMSSSDLITGETVLNRSKRQAAACGKYQWKCRDGSCIGFDGKCDGLVDCPDGSDETYPLCTGTKCQANWFRCTYGACVDGTAPCNGVKDCADSSDELQPKCLNETDEVQGQFKCQNGQLIQASNRCDGVPDCTDRSDETVRACAANKCPSYLFQCAYGACVDRGSDCDGKVDCADGSDESDELCDRMSSGTTSTTIKPSGTGGCILPQYPQHGSYIVAGAPYASPGQAFEVVYLNITCNPGYGVVGKSSLYCFSGSWSDDFPKCIRLCKLNKHPSVEYRCLITGANSVEGSRDCNDYEPSGTIVRPECRTPNYYYSGVLSFMHCVDGFWDYVAICTPECGKVTPEGEVLVIGGRAAKRGELPWHAGIYKKTTTPYKQICGGSLVTTTAVISAAHCFWSDVEKHEPASRFAIAVGKLYRPWNNPYDRDAQKSDVIDIKIPVRFQGVSANFQDDIALLILSTAIIYMPFVRPVCVDFDINFDRRQLQEGKQGKVAGWGLTAENGNASQVLKVVDLPYIKIEQCIVESPPGFREYITSDKICAGYRNGTALCKGDSGGGLAFPETDKGTERYYLRGIVSTAPNNENLCNAHTYTSFTQVSKHEHFIKENLSLF